MSEEELFANYSELFEKWTQLTEQSKQLKMSNLTMTQEKEQLLQQIQVLESENAVLEGKVKSLTRGVKMMNPSTGILDEILEKERHAKDKSGLGYMPQSQAEIKTQQGPSTFSGNTKTFNSQPWRTDKHQGSFSQAHTHTQDTQAGGRRSKHHGRQSQRTKRYNWRCYHCGKKGHIASYCYKLYGTGNNKFSQPRKVWVRKDSIEYHTVAHSQATTVCNVTLTSLKATAHDGWYFDSGCSRHMTGQSSNLINVKRGPGDFVTFGEVQKGRS